jgi:hypothetical protein
MLPHDSKSRLGRDNCSKANPPAPRAGASFCSRSSRRSLGYTRGKRLRTILADGAGALVLEARPDGKHSVCYT